MIDGIGRAGASLLSTGVVVLIFIAAIWLGLKTSERLPQTQSENKQVAVGCALILLWFFVIGFILWPSVEALKSYSCGKADDYEACMDPPDHEWM